MKLLLAAISLLVLPSLAHAIDLPAAIAKAGSITIANVPNYPPMEFRDPATNDLTGFDIDLGTTIAQKLGIKVVWQETSFDQMIPAIATGRVQAVMSGMTDLATRHATASFVDYLRSGPRFFVQKARIAEFADMTALCGKKIGAARRTSFPNEIAVWNQAHCAGKSPITVVGTEGSADARIQLKQGRVDAAVQGSETLPWIMELEHDIYAPLGQPIAYQYTGIALAVKDTDLQQAIAGALDALILDGTYKRLLDKWKLSENAVEKAMINAGQ